MTVFSISRLSSTLQRMEITPEALKEFKRIYEGYYKETITEAEALEKAQRVLEYISIVSRPFPKEWIESSDPQDQKKEILTTVSKLILCRKTCQSISYIVENQAKPKTGRCSPLNHREMN